METIKASKLSWKHIVCCALILVIFVSTVGIHINAEDNFTNQENELADSSEVVPLRSNTFVLLNRLINNEDKNEVKLAGPKEEVTVEVNYLECYITNYLDKIKFYSKVFQVNYEDIVNDLYEIHPNNEFFDYNNVGLLEDENGLKTFDSIDYGLVEYFYNFIKLHPEKQNKKRIPYEGSSSYIENLIIYYTTHIYTNVDTRVALSIGASESGYYKVKFMLRKNNVYGGMSSNGLIQYDNIEYGVLSYIKLLSKSYYSKGLDTVEKIGRVYCPVYDEFGNKQASQHWINLVYTAINKYNKYDLSIEVDDLQLNEM